MASGSVEVKITDTRSLRCPVPADAVDTEQLGKALVAAGQEGYSMTGAHAVQGGNQRDPYTVAIEITVSR